MAISTDDEVRAAAIAQVRKLRDLHGGRIPREALMEGVTLGGRRIGVDPKARVHVREDVLKEKDGPMLRHGLQEVDGARLILPKKDALRPNPEFLAERFERFLAA